MIERMDDIAEVERFGWKLVVVVDNLEYYVSPDGKNVFRRNSEMAPGIMHFYCAMETWKNGGMEKAMGV